MPVRSRPSLPIRRRPPCTSPLPFSNAPQRTRARSPGQGPRHLRRSATRSLIVATDRISAFDYVLGIGHPGQGQGPDAALGVLVRADARTSSRTTCSSTDVATIPGAACRARRRCCAAASMLVRKTDAVSDRVRGARLPVGLGLEGLLSRPARSAASRCPPACASPTGCPNPIFTPATKAETGHDINISEAEAGGARRRATRRHAARPDAGALRARRRARRVAAASSSPTRSSSSAGRDRHGEHHPDRRGADARLVALLAARPLRARRTAAELRQAVRARLPRSDSLEQAAAGARRCPTTSWRRRATSTSRRFAASPAGSSQ